MIFCKRCGNYASDGLDACPKCNANLFESGHPSLVGGMIVNAVPAAGHSAAAMAAGAMFGASSMEPAGHLQRFVALIIDSLLQALIIGIGFAGVIFIGDMVGLGILIVTVLIGGLIYEPYFIGSKGATPGKSAMGLRVVSKDGSAVSMNQSVIRWFLKNILNQFFIPLFIPLFTERRQGLHDMIVGTVVVRG